jgi:hypothetical protein
MPRRVGLGGVLDRFRHHRRYRGGNDGSFAGISAWLRGRNCRLFYGLGRDRARDRGSGV